MAKTEETLALERALEERSRKKREYGCTEVTIGFHHDGHGDEIADYMSMDSEGVFRCYEIKVTFSDLCSGNRLSWYGDYNYLVVSEKLYLRSPDWDQYLPPYVGILVGCDLAARRNARQKAVRAQDRDMLKDSLLRSVYWKMTQYRDAGDPSVLRAKERELQELEEKYEQYMQKTDRLSWTCGDYERYYAMNHQLPEFSLEEACRRERRQYQSRRKGTMTWLRKEEAYICPECGSSASAETPFCPFCGADLRRMKVMRRDF